ncbi:unnamed protein product [Sordaria macrospora k-hell]|uniref:WGS project CABT00000000 data, contig 2.3 n=1 Tax=Sordaria macrospora (strain ATCC MYA-333 / DSM 997 / K(L3346) / K-hell) TaxID=771870 RepID=F7VNY9_SORMK|nr:uncharacterized protein SMAC_06266 [Sordaria macrospora k-hell]KAH7636165.1 hypothetical protein B0T09DRAFT_251917 [Sordaria sp. MPI-SDFR-AT-0083]CCC07216.1 unnamed protein product [Sordaria macrospora k-hell]
MSASEVQEGAAAALEEVATTKEVPKETVQEVTNDHEKEDAASSPVTETKDKDNQRPASLAPSTDLSDTDDKDTVSPIPYLPLGRTSRTSATQNFQMRKARGPT